MRLGIHIDANKKNCELQEEQKYVMIVESKQKQQAIECKNHDTEMS